MSTKMEVVEIERSMLVENKYNPRKRFDTAKMKELEESLKTVGFMQPLLVRPTDNGKYEVVAGMRRYMASKSIPKIPCYIREMDNQTAKLYSLIENLERAELTPMEEARAFADYLDWKIDLAHLQVRKDGMEKKVIKFAKQIPMGERTIYKRLRLLYLPSKVQMMLENENLYTREAEAIAGLKKLIKIRKDSLSKNTTKEKITKKITDEFWPEAQATMQEITKSLIGNIQDRNKRKMDLPRLNERIKNILQSIKDEGEAKSEHQIQLQEKFDKSHKELSDFLVVIPDFDFDDGLLRQDSQTLKDTLQEKLEAFTEVKEITNQKRDLEDERDRLTVTRKFVMEKITDSCPYCGAGIEVANLAKRIQESGERIADLDQQENLISKEKKDVNKVINKLDNLLGEYDHRLTMLEEGDA